MKIEKDMSYSEISDLVLNEFDRAAKLHQESFVSPMEAFGALREEYLEVEEEFRKSHGSQVINGALMKECIQLAAMCLKTIKSCCVGSLYEPKPVIRQMTDEMIEDIARVCHDVNRAYCQALGDYSQAPWDEAEEWQRESAMNGVLLHLSNIDAGPEASHKSWMKEKLENGWVYGPEKNPDKKVHPCLVPFDQLPVEQQAKDYIFRAVVHAMAGIEADSDCD